MKKLLISLIILMNLIIVPVFAEEVTDINVVDTVNGAVNSSSGALYGFGESFDAVFNYALNHNYISIGDKYIMFPRYVTYQINATNTNVNITYQFIKSSSLNYNDKFVAITLNRSDFYAGHYDLWVGYTGDWSDITAFTIDYDYNYSDLTSTLGPYDYTVNTAAVKNSWGSKWQTNFLFNNSNYLLISDYKNVALFGGLYYSLISSQDIIPTYYGEFGGGFASGTWDDWYIVNPNYVINVFRNNSANIANINTDIYVTSNSITFDNGVNNNELIDLNVNTLWGTLKNAVYNLLSGFNVLILLFTIIFSWLPVEFVSVIYSGLILACTLLIVKVLRGG